jgi:cytidine deaminase
MKKQLTLHYDLYDSIDELQDSYKRLYAKAVLALDSSYSPYSKFKVATALELENGEIVLGANQENVAYPSGLCAERVALFSSGVQFPGVSIKKLMVLGKGRFVEENIFISPCGSCRQVMLESNNRQASSFEIIILNQKGEVKVFPDIKTLVPFGFGD